MSNREGTVGHLPQKTTVEMEAQREQWIAPRHPQFRDRNVSITGLFWVQPVLSLLPLEDPGFCHRLT